MKPSLLATLILILVLGLSLALASPAQATAPMAAPIAPGGCSQGEILGGIAAGISGLALLFRKKRS